MNLHPTDRVRRSERSNPHPQVVVTAQTSIDQVNLDAAATQTHIPPRMWESLVLAAATVDEGHRLHDAIARIRTHDSFLVRPRIPLRVALSRHLAMGEQFAWVSVPPADPLVFDTISVAGDNTLVGQLKCPICLSDYKSGDKGSVLPCQHGFHEACIQAWTKDNSTCPICRMHLR
jgi:hypothetical protein